MANFNTIDDFDVNGKTVLVRIDINSPVDPNSGIILDDTRMKLHAETIKELSMKGAKTVILAHQSRPGKDDFTTLEQHAVVLSRAVGLEVKYVEPEFASANYLEEEVWECEDVIKRDHMDSWKIRTDFSETAFFYNSGGLYVLW